MTDFGDEVRIKDSRVQPNKEPPIPLFYFHVALFFFTPFSLSI